MAVVTRDIKSARKIVGGYDSTFKRFAHRAERRDARQRIQHALFIAEFDVQLRTKPRLTGWDIA